MMSKPSEAERRCMKEWKNKEWTLEEKVGKVRNGQHSYKGGKRKQKQKSRRRKEEKVGTRSCRALRAFCDQK